MARRHGPELALAVGFALFTCGSLLFVYTVTHELGHALAGLAFGQRLTTFDLRLWTLNPHVTLRGSLPPAQHLVQIGAGSALPLLLWAGFQLAASRRTGGALTLVKLLAALLVLNTLLPWIVIPLLITQGGTPARDDTIAFLRVSRLPPLLVSALALLLYAGGWLLFARTTPDVPQLWRAIRQPSPRALLVGARLPTIGLAVLVALALGIALGGGAVADSSSGIPAPPVGYTQVAAVNLNAGPYQARDVAELVVRRPDDVGIFIALREIDTSYLDFQLHGPDGYRAQLLHGEGYRALADSSHWTATLPPGTYRVQLTAARSAGSAVVYTHAGDTINREEE